MTTGSTASPHRLAAVIDALARRFGAPVSAEPPSADEAWLGWDAWVRVAADTRDRPRR